MKKRQIMVVGILFLSCVLSKAMQDVLINKILPQSIGNNVELWLQLKQYVNFAGVNKEWCEAVKPCIKIVLNKIVKSSAYTKDVMLRQAVHCSDVGTLYLVKALVQLGAQPQRKKWRGHECYRAYDALTPWYYSIKLKKLDIMYYFVDQCDVNINLWTKENNNPLTIAYKNNDEPLIQLLREKGAQPDFDVDGSSSKG